MNRTEKIQLRLTKDEVKRLKDLANSQGFTVSGFLRQSIHNNKQQKG